MNKIELLIEKTILYNQLVGEIKALKGEVKNIIPEGKTEIHNGYNVIHSSGGEKITRNNQGIIKGIIEYTKIAGNVVDEIVKKNEKVTKLNGNIRLLKQKTEKK